MTAFAAAAQTAATPQAVIERAQATGVLAGLQRAMSTPLEVVWLRTAAEIETWSGAGLAGATVGRTGWRYIFGGAAQFAPAPNEVARLVVSSLSLPKAPLSTGTLDLAGRGRLFVISPESPGRATPVRVALVLAAGSTLQVSDTASPGIQVEIKAPEHRALLLGNLASANVRRMLGLLVKPDSISASEANLRDGKLALRSGAEIELAALLDGRGAPAAPAVAVAVAPAPEPVVAPLQVAVAEVKYEKTPPAEAPTPAAETFDETQVARDVRPEPPIAVATVEPVVSGPAEESPAAPAPADPVAPVQEAPPAMASAPVEVAIQAEAVSVPQAPVVALESPKEIAPDEPVAVKPESFEVAVIKPEPVSVEPEAPAAPIGQVAAAVPMEPAAPIAAPVSAAHAEAVVPEPAPTVIAAIPAKPVIAIIETSPPPAKTPQQAADIERMRAEIEAEIARDRERLAHQQGLHAPAKRFVLGV